MIANLTEQTMDLLKKLQSDPVLEKVNTTTGISTGTGVVNYNLEPYAKTLYPVITPIRNKTPRFTDANGGNAVHWKVITAINPGHTFPGTVEGIRGALIDQTTDDRLASFVRFSLENSITEEAIMQAQGFDNALAIEADNLLRSMFIMEEEWLLVGNGPSGLPQPSAPSGVLGADGAMTAADTYCFVAALTYDGYRRASLATGVITSFSKSSPAAEQMTVNGGASKASAASAKVTTVAGELSVTWTVPAVPGAFAYAWYVNHTDNTPANAALAAITTTNQFVQVADATGIQKASQLATDFSKNTSAFDGLIVQALNGNGYYKSLDNAVLTGDNDGNVVEIDAALESFYTQWKVSPTKMWVSTQEARNITRKVLSGGTAPLYHFNVDNRGIAGVIGGSFVPVYNNKFSVGGPKAIPIEVHPNLPAGKIFFECDEIPYPLANIPGPYRMHLLRDYYQRLWPQTTETRFTSVNFYGVLQVYVPFAMGLLDNIGNG
jgi:hypothetical protein